MKKVIYFLIFILLLLWFIPSQAEESAGEPLTLLIYLCGSDLETRYGAASEDMEEIAEACAGNQDISVLIMIGGSNQWDIGGFSTEETTVLEIGARGSRIVQRYPQMNMGDSDTLSVFLQFACEYRPESRYALIFWDHGAGPLEGVCFDQPSGMDSLTLRELNSGLKNSPFAGEKHLSWIGFDACLMATLETAICCASYADYLVASQETEPVSGWDYSFLQDVSRSESSLDTCRRILTSYMENKSVKDTLTLSLIDLQMIQLLARRTEALFDSINLKLNKYTFSGYSQSRLRAHSFGKANTASDYDLVDLGDLADQLKTDSPEYSADLQKALSGAVLQSVGNQEHACGLSIYSPSENKNAFSIKWMDTYAGLNLMPDYNRFLVRFGGIWTGEVLADWTNLDVSAGPLRKDGSQTLSLNLTDEQLTHIASASVHILEDFGSDSYWNDTCLVDMVTLDGNTLYTDYSFDALYAVDEEGMIQTSEIPFRAVGNQYLIYAFMETETVFTHGNPERMAVAMLCRRTEGTDELEIYNIFPISEDPDAINLGRQSVSLDPKKWRFVRFWNFPQESETDENGLLLPVTRWKNIGSNMINMNAVSSDGDTVPWEEFCNWSDEEIIASGLHHETEADNSAPWKFKFCRRRATGRNLAAQIVVVDTQGNQYGSRLIPLKDPNVVSSTVLDCEPRTIDGCRILPLELKALKHDSSSEILLRVRVENPTEQVKNLCLNGMMINGIGFSRYLLTVLESSREIAPGETCLVDFYLDQTYFPFQDDPVIHSVSFVPFFMESGFTSEKYDDRITIETDLDVSMLSCPERSAIEPAASDFIDEGIYFDLLKLEASETGTLNGLVHIRNEGDQPMWIIYFIDSGDDLATAEINETFVHNCLSFDYMHFLLPGGEGYFSFSIQPDPGRNYTISETFSLPDRTPREQSVSQISETGFVIIARPFSLTSSLNAVWTIHFYLHEPVELPVSCNLVFSSSQGN